MKTKTLSILMLFCLMLLPAMAQDEQNKGIKFENLSLKEALAKAKAEGKKVFVDCYTQTCGPCKYMMRNIFPLQECGDYFNPRFVSIARDMDTLDGPEMRKTYDVGIYPTFLIINPDGTLYCKEIGAVRLNSQTTFVEKMKRALERTELAARYAAGDRDVEMVKRYVELLKGSGNMKAGEVVNEFFAPMTVADLCKPSNWSMLKEEVSSPDAPVFRKLLDNRDVFEKQLGRNEVEGKIISTYQGEFAMYKMMGMPFAKRIADLQQLVKAGYKQAQPLADCMTVRWIINDKKSDRAGEIVTILQHLKSAPTADVMAVVKELPRFERVASESQRRQACAALESLKKGLTATDATAIDQAISRFAPGK